MQIIPSLRRFVALSLCRFVALSLCRFVALSPCRFVALSPCRFVALSLCRFVALSLCCLVAQSPCRLVAQSLLLPFGIAPYQKTEGVVAKFKAAAVEAEVIQPSEENPMIIRAVKVEWKDKPFDTVVVQMIGQPAQAMQITLIRVCEEDDVEKAVESLIDDMTEIYGAPTENEVGYASWTRLLRQPVYIGQREDAMSVFAVIDVESMVLRRPTTESDWPFEIPIDAVRDEIEKIVVKACGRVIEKDEMFLSTAGCNVLGVQSRRMVVFNDGSGQIERMEARFDLKKQKEVQSALEEKYGPPSITTKGEIAWYFVGLTDAIQITEEEDELLVVFDVLALERKQYSE